MIPHQQQEFQASNQFTFSSPIHKASNDLNSLDAIEYGTWAERITGPYGHFGKSDDRKFGAWQRRTPLNHHGNQVDEDDEFKRLAKEKDHDSDVPTPRLWKKPEFPMTERAQAIARYRQEMLDLVRDKPEAAYDLTLRDLVQSPKIAKPVQETLEKGGEFSKEKRKKGRRRMSRSESMEPGGLLIKMFLPNSLTGGRKSLGVSGACAKISPKLMLEEGEKDGLETRTDGDWWKKNTLCEKGSSSSSSSSSSSTNSSSTSRRRKMSGCYSLFHTNKHKDRESEGEGEGDSVL